MKQGWKHFIMGASTMAVLMGGLTFAANRSETIQRTFRDIKIKLNGTEITPKDANGKTVEPFIIDGTTYLPVRAVGEAMGLNVDWDGETSTVKLNGSAELVSLISVENNLSQEFHDMGPESDTFIIPFFQGTSSDIMKANLTVLEEIRQGDEYIYSNVECDQVDNILSVRWILNPLVDVQVDTYEGGKAIWKGRDHREYQWYFDTTTMKELDYDESRQRMGT